MKPHRITITVDSDGDFTYSPSTLHAKLADTVSWTSGALGPFAISFTDSTPFPIVTLSSYKNAMGEHVIDPQQIQEDTIGHHHYAVAVAQITEGPNLPMSAKVYLDSGCPDIVVSDN